MPSELDDIRAQVDCPSCAAEFGILYRTLRLGRTVECPGCGVTIKPIDDTPLEAIQRLIDEAGGPDTAD